jgi:myo-inositol-1(or 4)-monophosphatase
MSVLSASTTLSVEELKHRLVVAKEACIMAGKIQMEQDRSQLRIEIKSSSIDLVTQVDHACDEAIRNHLRSSFPNDLMLTEETYLNGQTIDLSHTWIVDPVDGTTNYAHGFPHFCVSIAFAVNGEPVVGVIYDPCRKELFSAIKGQGAWLESENKHAPIHVSQVPTMDQALLATGFPYDTVIKPLDNVPYFAAFLGKCHGVRRPGSAALDLAYLAAGRIDGFWEFRLAPWDIAAGALMVVEAGGFISGFSGEPLNFSDRHITILGGNHRKMLDEVIQVCQVVNQEKKMAN